MIVREARLLMMATTFLTRLPLWCLRELGPTELNRSSRYFSLVGMGIGCVAGATYVASLWVFPPVLAVLLAVSSAIVLTGAFHEDGLADSMDAFGGAMARDDVLRILQDPRIGTFGAVALLATFGARVAALTHIPAEQVPLAFVCAHGASRALCVLVMASGSYARTSGGRTRAVASGTGNLDAAIAFALALCPFLFAPAPWAWSLGAMLIVAALLYSYFRARIGGYTGDCLGAIQQLTEITLYLVVLGLL